jgi:hypothetical protein
MSTNIIYLTNCHSQSNLCNSATFYLFVINVMVDKQKLKLSVKKHKKIINVG